MGARMADIEDLKLLLAVFTDAKVESFKRLGSGQSDKDKQTSLL